ncbi:MAG: hypothetical protein K9G26_02895 [Emcibacter sp.]|nr:hypothetical protein [Emcibacter sp.]
MTISTISTLLHDVETTRRVARVLLKHVGPQNKTEAMTILHSRIGAYVSDNNAFIKEIDQYFM